jgi:hypothetical protein
MESVNYTGYTWIEHCIDCQDDDVRGYACIGNERPCGRTVCIRCVRQNDLPTNPFRCTACMPILSSDTDTDPGMYEGEDGLYVYDDSRINDEIAWLVYLRSRRYTEPSNRVSISTLRRLAREYGITVGTLCSKETLCQLVADHEIRNGLPAYNETAERYTIQEITAQRVGSHEEEFLVKWEGYDADTWEPESGLPLQTVREFRLRNI